MSAPDPGNGVFTWLARCERERDTAVAALAAMEAKKDGSYEERYQVVALLAHVALLLGWRVGTRPHEGDSWGPRWRSVVVIDLPTGQVTWHYPEEWAHLYTGLPPYTGPWDGHDTAEKYRRLRAVLQESPVPAQTGVLPSQANRGSHRLGHQESGARQGSQGQGRGAHHTRPAVIRASLPDLDALEALAAAATPGPCPRCEGSMFLWTWDAQGLPRPVCDCRERLQRATEAYTAAALEAVLPLVAEVKRLRAALAERG